MVVTHVRKKQQVNFQRHFISKQTQIHVLSAGLITENSNVLVLMFRLPDLLKICRNLMHVKANTPTRMCVHIGGERKMGKTAFYQSLPSNTQQAEAVKILKIYLMHPSVCLFVLHYVSRPHNIESTNRTSTTVKWISRKLCYIFQIFWLQACPIKIC